MALTFLSKQVDGAGEGAGVMIVTTGARDGGEVSCVSVGCDHITD